MGFRYAIFHTCCHLLFVFLISFILKLNFEYFLLVLIAQFAIDLDHLVFLRGKTLKEFLSIITNFSKALNPHLHNFASLSLSMAGSFLIFTKVFFPIGIFSLSLFIHFLFDFLEDVLVFKMGIEHWKIGSR